MSGFDSFLGNGQLISRLKRDVAAKRLAHAYIIEGARGCGKHTLAKLICQAVSCDESAPPCMKCINCDKIMRDQSPDVITVEPEKGKVQLGVDVIRKLREEAVFAPIDLPKKIFIISDGNSMNTQAQNALLKILEEPPPHVMFLILSENAEGLLSTVRSRAPILRIGSLKDEEIINRLTGESEELRIMQKNEPDVFMAAVRLAHGSLGTAKELLASRGEGDTFTLYKQAQKFIELLADRKTPQDDLHFFEHASKLVSVKQRSEFEKVAELLSHAARDLVMAKLTSAAEPIFFQTPEKAASLASRFTLSRLLTLTEIFTQAKCSSEHNVNISLAQIYTAISAMNAGRTTNQ